MTSRKRGIWRYFTRQISSIVRWYVMTMGNGFNFHTPHWHGNLVSVRGQYMDVIPAIGPAQFVTADMTPDMALERGCSIATWMTT